MVAWRIIHARKAARRVAGAAVRNILEAARRRDAASKRRSGRLVEVEEGAGRAVVARLAAAAVARVLAGAKRGGDTEGGPGGDAVRARMDTAGGAVGARQRRETDGASRKRNRGRPPGAAVAVGRAREAGGDVVRARVGGSQRAVGARGREVARAASRSRVEGRPPGAAAAEARERELDAAQRAQREQRLERRRAEAGAREADTRRAIGPVAGRTRTARTAGVVDVERVTAERRKAARSFPAKGDG